ncbi:MAG TPA: sensor domain-containing diguanylate cyclase [Kofleriaceae bacterium]|nr:sensor domain-containing diguanylate cyclase [Kofleriaceae bacterium]
MRVPRAVRRLVRVAGFSAVAAAAVIAVALGAAARSDARGQLASAVFVTSVAALVILAIARRLQFEAPSARAQRVSIILRAAEALADCELSLAVAAGLYAAVALTGDSASPLYPLIYGFVAFAVSIQGRTGGSLATGAVLFLEIAQAQRTGAGTTIIVVHLAAILGAAALHAVFLRGTFLLLRHRHDQRIKAEILAQRQSARDFRLIASTLGAESRARRERDDEESMLAAGSVEVISASIYFTLGLLKRSLEARTCILLWLDETGTQLTIKECATDADTVIEAPVLGLSGALGAVVRDARPLRLAAARPNQVPYYEAGTEIGAFIGVPVMDGAHVRGVLCADRPHPFSDDDAAFAAGSSDHIVRAVQSEQVFAAVERAKYEHERFYQASAMLGRALTLEQVMETAFDAAAEIAGYEAGAIALYDRTTRKHRVAAARTNDGGRLCDPTRIADLEFRDNTGLVAMAVKNRHYLPAQGDARDLRAPVFTRRIRLRNLQSLLVLPLCSGDEAIGSFTLMSSSANRFGKDVREMLGIIANQVAVSIQNAMMYTKMETMATTDGLTGLTNHRSFQERFGDLLERAARHHQPAAFLLCDVDHFKNVNDTYGHPIGDEVLRQVARVLRGAVRKIDIPARYGGEEFVVVLESTDLAGAVLLANRIRNDISDVVVESEQGPFSVTMSIGVAAFPDDGTDRATLIDHADQALYHAKENGRNRVVSYREHLAATTRRAS